MAQATHTVCLRSSDAKQLNQGTFQWTLNAPNLKTISSKALLASIELPMSQWSIEEDWSRVYCVERILLTPARRQLEIREVSLDGEREGSTRAVSVMLPLHLNHIKALWSSSGKINVETEEPHGLTSAIFKWAADYEKHVKIVCSHVDTIDLTQAWSEGRLTIDSPTEIKIQPKMSLSSAISKRGGGYLHVPSPPTPSALADALTLTLRATSDFGHRLSVAFDPDDCAFFCSLAAYPTPDTYRVRVSVTGDDLAKIMGLFNTSRVFSRRVLDPRTAGYASTQGREFLQKHIMSDVTTGDTPPLSIRGDASSMFGHARLRPGWYAPSQRIYSTSRPLRLPDEWELQFARFFFPRSEGEDKPPGLVYTDPFGVNRIAEIRPGLYTAVSIASYLEHMINQEAAGTYKFTITFLEGRFTFSCAANGIGLGFSIQFAHPRSVDPEKFGFEAAHLEGSDHYQSSHIVHEPMTPFGRLSNLYAITEVPGQRKFCIRPTAPPSVIGIAEAYDDASGRLTLRCVTSTSQSAVHGLHQGNVVTIVSSGYVHAGEKSGGGGAHNESIPEGTVAFGVVAKGTESTRLTFVEIEVSPQPWVHQAVKNAQSMTVLRSAEPSSFCFAKRLQKSSGGERLGFSDTTVQWGRDGVVNTRKMRVPPFISTGSHNLDHVDYVLLKLHESNKSTLMQHETGGEVQSIMGKVVLNPSYRHERHLPVEIGFAGGDRLDTLTLQVINPDGSDYNFHGASWSLSLTFAS